MKVKYLLVMILMFLFMTPSVYATCGKNDMLRIKDIANEIKITAQYAKDQNGKDTGYYDLMITGLTNELYMVEEITKEEYYYNLDYNGVFYISDLQEGKYRFKVYYDTCDELVRTIVYKLPKYNHYANNPLCEGIEEDELDVCNRTYQLELTDELFEEKINEYKNSFGLNNLEDNNQSNNIISFIKKYYIYIGIAILALIIIIISIVVKRRREVLE